MELTLVTEYFSLFSGLSPEESMRWLPLCKSAWARINACLRPGVLGEGHTERLAMVAGALAFYHYASTSSESGVKAMTVGDVRVERTALSANVPAKEHLDEMWSLASDLLIHPQGDLWMSC